MPRKRRPPRFHLAIWNGETLIVDERVTVRELMLLERVIRGCGVKDLSSYFGDGQLSRFIVKEKMDRGTAFGEERETVVTITRQDRRGKD